MAISYAPLPAYRPSGPFDAAPLQNALTENNKLAAEADKTDMLRQYHMGILGVKQQEAEQQKAQFDETQRHQKILQLGAAADAVDRLDPSDPNRQRGWNAIVGSHPDMADNLKKYNIDPTDHINGPKFISQEAKNEIAATTTPLQSAQIEQAKSTAQAHRAMAVNYAAMTQEHTQKALDQQLENENARLAANPDALLDAYNASSAAKTPEEKRAADARLSSIVGRPIKDDNDRNNLLRRAKPILATPTPVMTEDGLMMKETGVGGAAKKQAAPKARPDADDQDEAAQSVPAAQPSGGNPPGQMRLGGPDEATTGAVPAGASSPQGSIDNPHPGMSVTGPIVKTGEYYKDDKGQLRQRTGLLTSVVVNPAAAAAAAEPKIGAVNPPAPQVGAQPMQGVAVAPPQPGPQGAPQQTGPGPGPVTAAPSQAQGQGAGPGSQLPVGAAPMAQPALAAPAAQAALLEQRQNVINGLAPIVKSGKANDAQIQAYWHTIFGQPAGDGMKFDAGGDQVPAGEPRMNLGMPPQPQGAENDVQQAQVNPQRRQAMEDQGPAFKKLPNQPGMRPATDDEIQAYWRQHRGELPKGFIYNAEGRAEDLRDPKNKANPAAIKIFLNDIRQAKNVLAGPTDAKGNLTGEGPNLATIGAARLTGGWLGGSKYVEAYAAVEHAIAQLTAMTEGQRHANAMDVRFLNYFVPKWSDPEEIRAFKLSQAHRFFSGMLSKQDKVSDAQYGTLLQTELFKSAKEIQDKSNTLRQKQGLEPDYSITGAPNEEKTGPVTTGSGWSIRKLD